MRLIKNCLKLHIFIITSSISISIVTAQANANTEIPPNYAVICQGLENSISAHLSQEYKAGYQNGENYRLLSFKNIPLQNGKVFNYAVDVSNCKFHSTCVDSINVFNNYAGWTGAFAVNLDKQYLQVGMNFYKVACKRLKL